MSSSAPKKFVHNGKIVDSVPFQIRMQRFFKNLYSGLILYFWTLFAIDARQAALSAPNLDSSGSSSGSSSSSSSDQKRRLGTIHNSNS
ncbi:uncharacterized protein SAPINGB_P002070 [Magnusiomyces paraingens]|uniref:Uncharacterized protein n=1 Tax=Magnusiomyces paraingens TaxID=2606893 RepID=A0A5E8BK07_9ASCO|nr:uncharacterized protein SAPINGB_P002070 [Saprochaete ingens]VVT49031.1 unnamed protein product [Saprochaete ingens]